ncbi:unnamed protein product [Larinioides sclopetarius]|uniref:Serine/arginine-rich splicing factor 7 n=1 Tax=Larinioides sclopetarius TaxID=280406 RepID=A0AAV2A063_9ARAC
MSSRYRNSGPLDCKVYVGELGNSGTRHELEDAFSYYGPLRNVWVARNPPGFAFVEFEDSRDARDAVRGLDGKILCGRRVRVELSSGKSRSSYRPPPRYNPDERCYECGERGHYARDCRGPKRGRSRTLKYAILRNPGHDHDPLDVGLEVAPEAVLQVEVQLEDMLEDQEADRVLEAEMDEVLLEINKHCHLIGLFHGVAA